MTWRPIEEGPADAAKQLLRELIDRFEITPDRALPGERKPAMPIYRKEVVAAVEALAAGGELVFSMDRLCAAIVSCTSSGTRRMVAKAKLRVATALPPSDRGPRSFAVRYRGVGT